jgi:hypothetical protein
MNLTSNAKGIPLGKDPSLAYGGGVPQLNWSVIFNLAEVKYGIVKRRLLVILNFLYE